MNDVVIQNIMLEMIKYFNDDVKRINHAIKVYGFASNIGELENIPENKLQILKLAAILHDIGIKESERKYNSSSGKYQEIEGPPVARAILARYNLASEVVDRVCYLIGNHHTYANIDGIDFQIIVEADFLVNIFEDEMEKYQIQTIKQKYFRTKTGISYIESMYKI